MGHCQPSLWFFGLLKKTVHWANAIRTTDPITAINELGLRITACDLQSSERMADRVKRGVLPKGLALLAEVQKHVMKDWARLNSYEQMRAEVVDLLREEAALHMPMDVDGASLRLTKARGSQTTKARARERQREDRQKNQSLS